MQEIRERENERLREKICIGGEKSQKERKRHKRQKTRKVTKTVERSHRQKHRVALSNTERTPKGHREEKVDKWARKREVGRRESEKRRCLPVIAVRIEKEDGKMAISLAKIFRLMGLTD